MAHKKAAGSTRLGRDSKSKRLGVKIFGDQKAIAGNIIIRQHGTKFHSGKNTDMGKDNTIFALKDGLVKFQEKRVTAFTGNKDKRTFVSVVEKDEISSTKQGTISKESPKVKA